MSPLQHPEPGLCHKTPGQHHEPSNFQRARFRRSAPTRVASKGNFYLNARVRSGPVWTARIPQNPNRSAAPKGRRTSSHHTRRPDKPSPPKKTSTPGGPPLPAFPQAAARLPIKFPFWEGLSTTILGNHVTRARHREHGKSSTATSEVREFMVQLRQEFLSDHLRGKEGVRLIGGRPGWKVHRSLWQPT